MIAHLSYVMCDRCGNPAEPADYAKEARMLARAQGFARIGRGRTAEDVCPNCMGRAFDGIATSGPVGPAPEPPIAVTASPPLNQEPR